MEDYEDFNAMAMMPDGSMCMVMIDETSPVKDLRKIVEGPVEYVRGLWGDVWVWIAINSKSYEERLPFNHFATMARLGRNYHFGDEFICGNAVVLYFEV